MTRRKIIRLMIVSVALWAAPQATGHDVSGRADLKGVGVEEKSGAKVPGGASFLDEHGGRVSIGGLVDRPVLVLPIFYRCPQSCGLMLGNLASALNDVPMTPGIDFRVLCLSIDEEDGPTNAMQAKNNYLKVMKKNFPREHWSFLTGDLKNIRLFTDAVGYNFKKTARHDFVHPNVLIVLARDKTIIRYLHGPLLLPFDIGMAITEATKGTPAISVRKLMSYCFNYEPDKKRYAFRAVQILSAVFFLILGVIMFFLLRKKRQ